MNHRVKKGRLIVMKTTKRCLAFLSAAIMLMTAFAGCGKPGTSSSSSGSNVSNASGGDIQTGDNSAGESMESTDSADNSGENGNSIGGGTTSTGKTSGAATSSKKTSGSTSSQTVGQTERIDMGGYEFVLGTAYYANYLNSEGVLDPTNPLMKAVARVEKDYNCKIKFYKFADVSSAGTAVVNAVLAGDKICDVAQMQFSRCRTVAYSNACHDLKTLKGLDLTSGNFEQAITDAFTFNKKVYACNIGENSNVQGLFYNADLLKKYAPGYDVMKMYKEGTWTEAKFEEILRKISSTSGQKVTPLVGNTGVMALSTAVNAGGTSYKSGNKVTFGIVTADGIKALNYVKRLYNDQLWKYPADTSFATGGAVFTDGAVWNSKSYTSVKNLEFVPWPKGELNKYVVPAADGIAWCVPKTVKKKEYVGIILNALAESTAEMKSNRVRELEDNGWSANSIAVYNWMQSNHQIDMTTGPDISAYSKKIDDSVFVANIQPAAAMQSISAAAQKVFDDYYKQFIR